MRCLVLGALAWLALLSCSTMPVQELKKGVAYKYDMEITVDGIKRTGMLVARKLPTHEVTIKSHGDLDLFSVETCHRQIDSENVYTRKFIKKDKRNYSFEYAPSPTIETDGYCPVRLSGLTEKNGQSSWGFIDFEEPQTTLPALMQCDGAAPFQSNGVTVCQSRWGALQKITFPEKVVVTPDEGCEIPLPADQKQFLFPVARGFCVYNFTEVAPLAKQRRHRLTTYGFEQILIHGRD